MPYGMGPAGWGYHPYGRGGVGTPGDTVHSFPHGDHQPKKKRFGFSKKKLNTFEKSWARLRKGSKN